MDFEVTKQSLKVFEDKDLDAIESKLTSVSSKN